MSRETILDLQRNTLIGLNRRAWHDDPNLRAQRNLEDNHYEGFIPAEDVRRRLLNWNAVDTDLYVPKLDAGTDKLDVLEMMALPDQAAILAYVADKLGFEKIPSRKAYRRDDNGVVLGIHSDKYTLHPFDEYLLKKVEQIVYDSNLATGTYDGAEVGISSAGLLKKGAVAWVQIELPDWIVSRVAEIKLTPRLLASTSIDGSMATQYKMVNGIVVCDNTLEMASFEQTNQVRVRHSKNSLFTLEKARDKLGIALRDSGEAFGEQIDRLYTTPVSTTQWDRFLDEFTAAGTKAESTKGAKAQATRMDAKRDKMQHLWVRDPRVAPWSRTAWGVVQAVNTYNTWERSVKAATRQERNMLNVIRGENVKDDATTLQLLTKVGVLAGT